MQKVIRVDGDIKIFQINAPEFFREALSAAQKTSSHGAFVALRDLWEYRDCKLFVSDKGAAGVAVGSDGHIFSLFKNLDACKELGLENVAAKMMFTALANGGKKLDCFDGFLPHLYTTYGFEPVSKIKFTPDLASGVEWNYQRDGKPDLIFMKHNGHGIDRIIDQMGLYPKFASYNVKYAKDFHEAEKILDHAFLKPKEKEFIKMF